jgi:hypothetical protein
MEGGGGGAVIEAMGTAAQLYRSQAVGVPMREEKAKAGIANLALSRYNKQYAASQGDISSLYEIIEDGGGAEAFGKEMGERGQISNRAEKWIEGSENVLGLWSAFTGNKSSKTVSKAAQIVQMATKGAQIGGAVLKAVNEDDVTGAETKLEAILTKDQYNSAIAALKSQGGQALYNQSMSAANISIGAGDSKALETKLSSIDGMQDALTRGNLSPQEYLQVTAQVGQSVYGANHDRGDIAIRAGEMQKKRVMTTDQYTQAMGIQSAAGGSAGGLESILKRAVAAGVNDSKLLVEFVQLSASLNQSLTDAGSSAENHTAYSNRVQQMKEAGASEVLAARSAASQISSIDSMLQDTSVTEASIIKAGMIEKMIPNIATDERIYAQSATSGEMGKILQDTLSKDEEKSMLPVAKRIRKKIMGGEGGLAAGRASFEAQAELASFGHVGVMAQAQMDKSTPKGTGESAEEIRDAYLKRQSGKMVNLDQAAGKDFKNQAGMAESTIKDQGQGALNQIAQAAVTLGGVSETFKLITDSIKIITEKLDANKAVEDAKKAAENLEPDGKFSTAVGKFEQAVDKMRTKVGIDPVAKAAGDNSSKKVSQNQFAFNLNKDGTISP